jgi:hypothetical protein
MMLKDCYGGTTVNKERDILERDSGQEERPEHTRGIKSTLKVRSSNKIGNTSIRKAPQPNKIKIQAHSDHMLNLIQLSICSAQISNNMNAA